MARALILLAAAAVIARTSALTAEFLNRAGRNTKGDPQSITAAAVNKADIKFSDVEKTLKKDQKLTVDEFATFCTSNGVPWFMCKKVFEDADTNHDLKVIESEWKKLKPNQKDNVRAGFDSLNFNGDTSISKREWDAYCKAWMIPKPTKAQCDNLFKSADKNNNGMLDKVEFGSSSAGDANDANTSAVDKNAAYNKCWWVCVLLLLSCCCISPAAHFFHLRGKAPEAKAMNMAGQALSIVGCLIPFCACIYLLWWTNIGSEFWQKGFSAVGKLCGGLTIWASLYCCLGLCQLGFVCAMGGAAAGLMAGGKK